MEILLLLFIGLALLILIIFLIPLKLALKYHRHGEKDLLDLSLSLWPSLGMHYKIFMLDFKPGIPRTAVHYHAMNKTAFRKPVKKKQKIALPGLRELLLQFSFWSGIYRRIKPSVRYMASKIRMEELTWKTRFGLGDPYHTGMANGMVWALKGALASYFYPKIKAVQAPVFSVSPDFNKVCLATKLEIRLSTTAGSVMIGLARILATLIFGGQIVKMIRMMKRLKKKTALDSKSA